MNKIFSILAISAAAVSLSACSDFLDTSSDSQQTIDDAYESVYFTGQRINAIYGGLANDRTYVQDIPIKWGSNTDIELVDGLGDNATNSTHYRGVGNYNVDPGYTTLSGEWNKLYSVIEDCNECIQGISKSSLLSDGNASQKEMQRYLGEAYVLRAMLYFDMLRYWGDIPFVTEPSASDLSNVYVGKTDRDEIMDYLMEDLKKATELLPWADAVTGYTTEHATKGYAYGLLGQMALTRAGWAIREQAKEGYETATLDSDPTYPTQRPAEAKRQEMYKLAMESFTAIITNATHNLNPSFKNEWYLLNQLTLDKSYHENLFEIPMGLGATGELGYTCGLRMDKPGTSTYGYNNSPGALQLTSTLFYSYKENDTRRDVTCATIKLADDDNGITRETMVGNTPFALCVGKWDPRMMSEAWLAQNLAASGKVGYGINPVKMRYSQVLLYYAEAMNELAGPDAHYEGDAGMTAREALSEVHCRAYDNAFKSEAKAYVDGIAADKDAFFNALVDENKWELAGECVRKFDLIRWNLLSEKIREFKQEFITQLATGVYQETVYFNYKDEAKTQIDMESVTWNGVPDGKLSTDYQGSADSFGKCDLSKTSDKQVYTNLPSISSGLVGTTTVTADGTVSFEAPAVKNRYVMPIASTTISSSQGNLSNSYGYGN